MGGGAVVYIWAVLLVWGMKCRNKDIIIIVIYRAVCSKVVR